MSNDQILQRPFKLLLCILAFSVCLIPAKAQLPEGFPNEKENLDQLLTTLKKDQKAIKTWWGTWLGLYSAATVVQTGIAIQTQDKALKQDMYLSAATTFLGAGFQLITPTVKVDKSFFEGNENLTPEQRLEKMNRAYELLEKSAVYEAEGRSWKIHALTGAVNATTGLITWLAFDRPVDGLITFAINMAITETQIWTQPILAKKAYQKYASQYITGEYIPTKQPPAQFMASATASGFQLRVIF
ncbi:MAG: hypothetical protein JW798_06905 [Prolixibacteraceae bacterium]|nr:hypothetical protein [Prolixibacteraceae bacterium]